MYTTLYKIYIRVCAMRIRDNWFKDNERKNKPSTVHTTHLAGDVECVAAGLVL